MKRNLLTIILLFSLSRVLGQISLGTNDFSHAGDTFRVSMASPLTGMDLMGGSNHYWDYSGLDSISQTIDTFFNVANTPSYLNLYFSDFALNPNRCNQATFISTSVLSALEFR
jgi:hypothetical protein